MADHLSRNSVKEPESAGETDPIAGRVPRGLDGPDTFDAAAGPPAAAHAFEKFETDAAACAAIVVTEVSPFDTDTPTVFMCEYFFKSPSEVAEAKAAEVEACFAARAPDIKGGGASDVNEAFRQGSVRTDGPSAFVATRAQRNRDRENGASAEGDERTRSAGGSNVKAQLAANPGAKPSEVTRGGRTSAATDTVLMLMLRMLAWKERSKERHKMAAQWRTLCS